MAKNLGKIVGESGGLWMIDSTARATRFEADSSPAPAFLWAPSGKPVTVSIPLPVIDRLEKEAVESFRSLSSRGSEIGGLLFGSFAAGTPLDITIDGYEAIDCEYSRGPLYRLTDVELERLDRAIAQRVAAGGRAVGFYRSHTRKGLGLDADDFALFDSRFTEAHHIALLIRPNATKASMAGIFFREDGKVHGEASYLEFPFRSAQHEGSKRTESLYDGAVAGPRSVNASPAPAAARPVLRAQIVPIASRREVSPETPLTAPPPAPTAPETVEPSAPAPAPVAAAPVAAAPVESKATPAPAPAKEKAKAVEPPPAAPAPAPVVEAAPEAKPRSGKMPWILLGGAATLVLAVGLVFTSGVLSRKAPSVPTQDSSTLALRVDRNGGDIVLTWNRDSAVIKSASKAVLSINDGPQHENVEMDLAQLKNGSIVYAPVTSDVVFKMEVTGSDQLKTASESVRVLRTRPSPMADPNAQQAQSAAQPGAPKTEAPNTTAAEPASPAPEEEKVALAQAVKPFQKPLAQRLRPSSPSEITDAPVLGAPMAAAPNVNLGNLVGSHTPAAPAPAPPPVAEKKAVVGGQVQQAQLIKRRDPEYPRLARSSGAGGVVELTAQILTDGRVGEIKVLKGHPLLRQAAAEAVKGWVYRPAMLNGQPIETETQVLLNFKADGR
jgi:protein TonB